MKVAPRSLLLLALALAMAVLVVQARVIVGGKTWDDARYHTEVAPARLAAATAIARGDLPAWWDGASLGVPLAAEPSHGAAYPVTWVASTPHALDVMLVMHLLWLALGVAVWARRRSTEVGALVAGVVVATSGVVASALLRGALPALAQLPWVGIAATMLAEATRRRERALAALALGGLIGLIGLAGQLAVLVDAVVLAAIVATGGSGPRRATLGWLAAGAGAGLAIAAVQWIPAMFAIPASAGATVDGIGVARLIELVVPGSFGATAPAHGVVAIAGAHAWAPSLFVGAPLIALAAVSRPSGRAMIVMIVVAGFAAIAGRGGWPAWLGAPELHVAVLAVLAAAHAGAGVDALVDGDRRAVVAIGGAAASTALAVGGIAALRGFDPAVAPAVDRVFVDAGLGLACLAGVVVLAWRAPGRHASIVLALLVAPSVGATSSVYPAIDRAVIDEPPAWVTAATIAGPPRRIARPARMFDTPIDLDEAIATLAGTSAARWGLASVHSDDPARSPRDDRAWFASSNMGGEMLHRFGIELPILPSAILSTQGFVELGRRGRWALVRYPTAPAAAVMGNWQWTRDVDDALARLFPPSGGRGLGHGRIVLEGDGIPNEDAMVEPAPCSIDRWTDGAIDLTCRAESDAYAVVSSSCAAGWSVDVDGEAAGWVTADVLRRAVAMPAGSHVIRWRYTAPGSAAALLSGVLGVLALVAFGWIAWRRSER